MKKINAALLAALIAGSFALTSNVSANAERIIVTPGYGWHNGWRRHHDFYRTYDWNNGWGNNYWRWHRWHANRDWRWHRGWY